MYNMYMYIHCMYLDGKCIATLDGLAISDDESSVVQLPHQLNGFLSGDVGPIPERHQTLHLTLCNSVCVCVCVCVCVWRGDPGKMKIFSLTP